jgi:hypothetical protein
MRRWVMPSCAAVCSRCARLHQAHFALLHGRHLGVVGEFLEVEILFGAAGAR